MECLIPRFYIRSIFKSFEENLTLLKRRLIVSVDLKQFEKKIIIHGQSLKRKKWQKKTQETIYCFPSYLKIFQPKRFQIHFRSIFFNFIFSLWKIDFLDLMDLTTVPALWTITLTSFKPICNTSCMKWMTTWSYRSITSCCEWIHACWTSNRHLFEIVNLSKSAEIDPWLAKWYIPVLASYKLLK